jgi:hypothetical protein
MSNDTIIRVFMHGQELTRANAEAKYEELVREMTYLSHGTDTGAMEDLMFTNGLELDYVDELCSDILRRANA